MVLERLVCLWAQCFLVLPFYVQQLSFSNIFVYLKHDCTRFWQLTRAGHHMSVSLLSWLMVHLSEVSLAFKSSNHDSSETSESKLPVISLSVKAARVFWYFPNASFSFEVADSLLLESFLYSHRLEVNAIKTGVRRSSSRRAKSLVCSDTVRYGLCVTDFLAKDKKKKKKHWERNSSMLLFFLSFFYIFHFYCCAVPSPDFSNQNPGVEKL